MQKIYMIQYNTGDFFAFCAEVGTNFARNPQKNIWQYDTIHYSTLFDTFGKYTCNISLVKKSKTISDFFKKFKKALQMLNIYVIKKKSIEVNIY